MGQGQGQECQRCGGNCFFLRYSFHPGERSPSLPPHVLPPYLPTMQRVILKYIEAEHKDPANGEELTPDDLITVKSSKGKGGSGREGWREGGRRRG